MKNVPLKLMLGTLLILSSAVIGVQTSAHLQASAKPPCVHLDGITSSPSTDYGCKVLALAAMEEDSGFNWPHWIASSRSFQFHYLDLIEWVFSVRKTDTNI